MSEFPGAKCVRRSDLRSRSTSLASSNSDGVKQQWRYKLDVACKDAVSEQSTLNVHAPNETSSAVPGDLEEEAYEFQLFSQNSKTSAVSTPQPPKILLRSPSPEDKEPGFIRPVRSQKFYFTGAVTLDSKRQYQEAAIEGERVIRESQKAWPGFQCRWRLTTLTTPSRKQLNVNLDPLVITQAGKRKRPGKKRRIAFRTKTQARKRREEVVQLAEAEKAAFLAEKRTRRNREKQLKRREKARNQKKGEIVSEGSE